jgi:hypothetical protein
MIDKSRTMRMIIFKTRGEILFSFLAPQWGQKLLVKKTIAPHFLQNILYCGKLGGAWQAVIGLLVEKVYFTS